MDRANDTKIDDKPLAMKIPVMLSSVKQASKGTTAYISNDKLLVRTSVVFELDEIVQIRMKLPNDQIVILSAQAIFHKSDEEGPSVVLKLSPSGEQEQNWRAFIAEEKGITLQPHAKKQPTKPHASKPAKPQAPAVEEFRIKPNAPDAGEWNAGAHGALSFDDGSTDMDIGSLLQNNNEPLSFENIR